MAKMTNMRIPLAMNRRRTGPVLVKNGAGYVQKMPAVAFFE